MKILITGGAGYIGSNIVRSLHLYGKDKPVILDDLSAPGSASFAEKCKYDYKVIQMDLSKESSIKELVNVLLQNKIEAVIHLAAKKSVEHSMFNPEYYKEQNIGGTKNLLAAMKMAEVNKLIFSSSAAVYGNVEEELINEDYPCKPVNPYGETKLACEKLIKEAMKEWGLNAVILRYFNVAGGDDKSFSNLIPIALRANEFYNPIYVYGSDWNTPDGSCVRDYVYIEDVLTANFASLEYLKQENRKHTIFNVGTGKGSSVLEVVKTMEDTFGKKFIKVIKTNRRDGDTATLVADVSRIKEEMGWEAKYSLLNIMEKLKPATASEAFIGCFGCLSVFTVMFTGFYYLIQFFVNK